ncbi:MAG: Lpg1974 family pore-forming outer membrane protein [Xanthobacteraceae bacterium]
MLAGISSLALYAAIPSAFAADMALKTKAPPPPPPPTPAVTTWWFEGGASNMSGDPFVLGFNNPPFDVDAKRWGWQGAIGVDYKFASSPWHVSADFRYMGNGSQSAGGPETAIFTRGGAAVGTNTASRSEHNWEADFMVGRDLGIGSPAQAKFGLRVADIWGQTNGIVSGFTFAPSGVQTRNYQQTDKFLGAGPRLAIEGSIPLQTAWSIEYNGGVAGLWGQNSANQTVGVSGSFGGGGVTCLAGCPIAASSGSNVFVFNADAQAGLAYAISQSAKLSLNYRIDGYWNALRGFNSAGAGTNLDRVYSGPTLKLTVAY